MSPGTPMDLDPVTQVTILELAEAASRLDGLDARRHALPERAELTRLTSERAAQRTSTARLKLSAQDLGLDIKKMESDAAKLRKREEEAEKDLAEATDQEAVRDLRHEVESTRRRREALEHHIADARDMRDAHAINTGIEADDLAVRIRNAERKLADADADLLQQISGVERRIGELRDSIDPRVLKYYDRVAAETGHAVARLNGRACCSCFMELDASTMRDFDVLPPERLVKCPECGSYLVRPSTLAAAGKSDR